MGSKIELSIIVQVALSLAWAEREHADELSRHAELSATVARYKERMRLTVDYLDREVDHG